MTVKEVVQELLEHGLGTQVYIPDADGTAQICHQVVRLRHVNLPEGMSQSDDVALVTKGLAVMVTEHEPEKEASQQDS